jgi:hypothetical protein
MTRKLNETQTANEGSVFMMKNENEQNVETFICCEKLQKMPITTESRPIFGIPEIFLFCV